MFLVVVSVCIFARFAKMEGMTAEEAGTAEYSKMEEVIRWNGKRDTFVLYVIPKPSAGQSKGFADSENTPRGDGFGQDQGRKKKKLKGAAKKKLKKAAKINSTNDADSLASTLGAYVAPLASSAASSMPASSQAPALQQAEAEHDEVYPTLQRTFPAAAKLFFNAGEEAQHVVSHSF